MRAWLVFMILLASGCVGSSDPSVTASASSVAPLARVDDELGSISGTVRTDEQAPIEKAAILLAGIDNETLTDAEGRFTINGLVPATYSLSVHRIGFSTGGKKVDVRAGEVAEVTLILQPFAIAEPYIDARPVVSHIKLGESFVDIATHEGGLVGTFCDSCHVYVTFAPKPKDAFIEFAWTPSVGVPPVINDDIFFQICKDYQNGTTASYRCGGAGSSGTVVSSAYMNNRQGRSFKEVGNNAVVRYDVHAGESLAYELRLTAWLSFAYDQELPSGYTALPPK